MSLLVFALKQAPGLPPLAVPLPLKLVCRARLMAAYSQDIPACTHICRRCRTPEGTQLQVAHGSRHLPAGLATLDGLHHEDSRERVAPGPPVPARAEQHWTFPGCFQYPVH